MLERGTLPEAAQTSGPIMARLSDPRSPKWVRRGFEIAKILLGAVMGGSLLFSAWSFGSQAVEQERQSEAQLKQADLLGQDQGHTQTQLALLRDQNKLLLETRDLAAAELKHQEQRTEQEQRDQRQARRLHLLETLYATQPGGCTAPGEADDEPAKRCAPAASLPARRLALSEWLALAKHPQDPPQPLALAALPSASFDLAGVDLTGADLSRADLADAKLTGAKLAGVRLTGADLKDADLTDADLTGAACDKATKLPKTHACDEVGHLALKQP
jgi:hypothetical protein